ncbi:uncharacterized protein LOC132626295 isoform X2 [Lycium barbarum]|uniref:uncharacterized protein LOC132626295 isoform X2 n=1 Tax=Lycium barbarum TaxID=112863 RepID=UPI00293F5C77|nr:uncharacterized protein LOC132626295 isoform X2 [Lycium barbarum]
MAEKRMKHLWLHRFHDFLHQNSSKHLMKVCELEAQRLQLHSCSRLLTKKSEMIGELEAQRLQLHSCSRLLTKKVRIHVWCKGQDFANQLR